CHYTEKRFPKAHAIPPTKKCMTEAAHQKMQNFNATTHLFSIILSQSTGFFNSDFPVFATNGTNGLSKILLKAHSYQHPLTLFLCCAGNVFSEAPQKCPNIKEKTACLKLFFYNVENFPEKKFPAVEKSLHFDCLEMYTISVF
ncbi:MAG: hypothetical protein IJC78_07820, partial [Clostridia bacterium]|nr:hypothetical protein [Clostridia bacterium]